MSERESMDWDDYAGTWEDDPSVRQYAEKAFATLRQHGLPLLRSVGDSRVLDFGCGTGHLTRELAMHCASVVAIDASAKMIARLREKLNDETLANVQTCICNLEEQSPARFDELRQPFDMIVASSVCGFLKSYPQALKTLVELLRPDGVFVQWDWERGDDAPGSGLSRGEIASAFSNADLSAIRIEPSFQFAVASESLRVIMGIGRKGHAAP